MKDRFVFYCEFNTRQCRVEAQPASTLPSTHPLFSPMPGNFRLQVIGDCVPSTEQIVKRDKLFSEVDVIFTDWMRAVS